MSLFGMLVVGVLVTLAQPQAADVTKPPVMDRRSYSDDENQRLLECDLSNKLHATLDAWLIEKGSTQVAACEKVIENLITQGQPSVEAYYLAAKASELIGKTAKAVTILKKALMVHPNGWTPGPPIPIKISANMWMGRLHREGGDGLAAVEAFTAAEAAAATFTETDVDIAVLCKLYLAEVQDEMLGDKEKAKETLASIVELRSSVTTKGPDAAVFFAEWARQRLDVMKGASRDTLGCTSDYAPYAAILAKRQLDLVGVLGPPRTDFYGRGKTGRELFAASLETALANPIGESDRDASRLLLGGLWLGTKEYAKAEAVLSDLRQANSYLSPVAAVEQARCQFALGRPDEASVTLDAVKQKWPSYAEIVEECRANRGEPRKPGRPTKKPATPPSAPQ